MSEGEIRPKSEIPSQLFHQPNIGDLVRPLQLRPSQIEEYLFRIGDESKRTGEYPFDPEVTRDGEAGTITLTRRSLEVQSLSPEGIEVGVAVQHVLDTQGILRKVAVIRDADSIVPSMGREFTYENTDGGLRLVRIDDYYILGPDNKRMAAYHTLGADGQQEIHYTPASETLTKALTEVSGYPNAFEVVDLGVQLDSLKRLIAETPNCPARILSSSDNELVIQHYKYVNFKNPYSEVGGYWGYVELNTLRFVKNSAGKWQRTESDATYLYGTADEQFAASPYLIEATVDKSGAYRGYRQFNGWNPQTTETYIPRSLAVEDESGKPAGSIDVYDIARITYDRNHPEGFDQSSTFVESVLLRDALIGVRGSFDVQVAEKLLNTAGEPVELRIQDADGKTQVNPAGVMLERTITLSSGKTIRVLLQLNEEKRIDQSQAIRIQLVS